MKTYLISGFLGILIALFTISYLANTYGNTVLPTAVLADTSLVFYSSRILSKETKRFEEVLRRLHTTSGKYAIYIENLKTGEKHVLNAREEFFGASLYKVPVATAAYKSIQEQTPLGLSIDTESSPPEVEEVLSKLLKQSDNSAQKMLTNGISVARLHNAFTAVTLNSTSRFFSENITTPAEAALMFKTLYGFANTQPSQNYITQRNAQKLLGALTRTSFDNRISSGLSGNTVFAHKIGNWPKDGTWHDCGLIIKEETLVVCVMSKGTTFEEFLEVTHMVGNFIETI